MKETSEFEERIIQFGKAHGVDSVLVSVDGLAMTAVPARKKAAQFHRYESSGGVEVEAIRWDGSGGVFGVLLKRGLNPTRCCRVDHDLMVRVVSLTSHVEAVLMLGQYLRVSENGDVHACAPNPFEAHYTLIQPLITKEELLIYIDIRAKLEARIEDITGLRFDDRDESYFINVTVGHQGVLVQFESEDEDSEERLDRADFLDPDFLDRRQAEAEAKAQAARVVRDASNERGRVGRLAYESAVANYDAQQMAARAKVSINSDTAGTIDPEPVLTAPNPGAEYIDQLTTNAGE